MELGNDSVKITTQHCRVFGIYGLEILQGCNLYRPCSVADLNKEYLYEVSSRNRSSMKQIRISEELFIKLVKYHLLEVEKDKEQIEKGLEEKLDAMAKRELYTTYKTATSPVEKENARQEYLNKRGVLDSFRW